MIKLRSKLFLIGILSVLTFACGEDEDKNTLALPILGERDVEYKTVDGEEVADTIYHQVPEFEYINQDSIWIDSKDLKGKVWVADFFFTHCPSICPVMTTQMKRLNILTKDLEKQVQFLSFSIDPERDQPSRIREFIKMHGIEAKNWHFLTGDEEETHLMAKFYFNGAERDPEAEGGFGHTDYFALIDRKGYVRGIYRGTDSKEVDRMEKDIRKLLKHEYGVVGSK